MVENQFCVMEKGNLFKSLHREVEKINFLLKVICAYSNDFIIVLDEKRRIISCSESFFELVNDREIPGESFFEVISKIIDLPNDFLAQKSC